MAAENIKCDLFLLVIFLSQTFSPVTALSCAHAAEHWFSEMGEVRVENCEDFKLNLFKSSLNKISSLTLYNMTRLTLILGPHSFVNIDELIIIDTSIINSVTFISKTKFSLVLENCDFEKDVHVYHKTYEGNIYLSENKFHGALDIFINGTSGVDGEPVYLSLQDNTAARTRLLLAGAALHMHSNTLTRDSHKAISDIFLQWALISKKPCVASLYCVDGRPAALPGRTVRP